ncbi:MAG: serine/threonine-protein kinase [Polyangiaceae bacterium]
MPDRLGRYNVCAKIGEGGMATVYLGRANDVVDDRYVALKAIKSAYSSNREFVDMFLDEAKIVSGLEHPNIVRLYELGIEGHLPFLALELLAGQSLWQLWQACRERSVRMRYDMIAWIGARVADGLHYAHGHKDANGLPLAIVHRDVNATNLFVTYDGDVKIIDFGLAKAANRVSRTAAGIIKGKAAYMSPEQTMGQPLDPRTDVFALGITLWEIAVDRRLFKQEDDVETLKRVHAALVPDPTQLVDGFPPGLWNVLKKALARDRNDRFASAGDFAKALDAFVLETGKATGPQPVAKAMNSLFAKERKEFEAWFTQASSARQPVAMPTLHPAPNRLADADGDDLPPPSVAAPLSRPSEAHKSYAPPVGIFEPAEFPREVSSLGTAPTNPVAVVGAKADPDSESGVKSFLDAPAKTPDIVVVEKDAPSAAPGAAPKGGAVVVAVTATLLVMAAVAFAIAWTR